MNKELRITTKEGDTIELWLTKEKTPVVYERKKYELIHQSGMTEAQAEAYISQAPLVLDVFYSIGQGVFTVESEAIESCEIYNPYTGMEIPNDNLIYKSHDNKTE